MSDYAAIAVNITTGKGLQVFEQIRVLATDLALSEGVSVEVVTDYDGATELADRMWEGYEEWDSSGCEWTRSSEDC